jgi:acetyltransferase-like isoleucine patch superfamily enzyme
MPNTKPLIFLGSNSVMELYSETCDENGIVVAGIIDSDYYGSRDTVCGIPIIDSESSFENPEQLAYYRENFVFFCAVNWQPVDTEINQRNRKKRQHYIDLINQHDLTCINIIDQRAKVSPSAQLGKGIYVGEFATLDPRVQIGDFVNIYGQCHIGHDTQIGVNSVIQRRCSLVGELTVESNVFVASNVYLLKNHARIGQGTFVHECIYLRRGTVANEIVSLQGANLRRVRAYPCEVD